MNICRVTVRGALHWLVDCRAGGGGERRYFTSKKSAEIFAADKRTEIAMLGHSLLKIFPSERLDLGWFHEQARASGTPARQIFREWKTWKADRARPTDAALKIILA